MIHRSPGRVCFGGDEVRKGCPESGDADMEWGRWRVQWILRRVFDRCVKSSSQCTEYPIVAWSGSAGIVGGRARPGRVRGSIGVGLSPAGSDWLVLEVLLWSVRQYSEQGVMLHVCSKAFQCRPFRMTWLEVGARRARRAVGGAWRDSATMCYSGPGAGRSGGVLPGPVALRALEVASYRRSRGQGSGSTTHL